MSTPDYIFLIIEDNVIDQMVTGKLLKKITSSQHVSIVNNGLEGIHWLQKNHAHPTENLIILLDLKMPVMDGFEFLVAYEKLTEDLKKHTQIFILSSTLNADDIDRAKRNRNVITILSKPLPFEAFSTMIYPNSEQND